MRADDLAAVPIKALMARHPNLDWTALDEVMLGCANQAGEDNRNVARMAALLSGLAAGSVSLQVSYSPFKGFDPAAVALALNRYPYGCTEQLVSISTPMLYADDFTGNATIRQHLAESVGKLLDRQSLDGAFGLLLHPRIEAGLPARPTLQTERQQRLDDPIEDAENQAPVAAQPTAPRTEIIEDLYENPE